MTVIKSEPGDKDKQSMLFLHQFVLLSTLVQALPARLCHSRATVTLGGDELRGMIDDPPLEADLV